MANFSSGFGMDPNMRDFAHAARTFTASPGYPMAPKTGFSFHVRFVYEQNNSTSGDNTTTLAVLVKAIDLPKFNIETEVLNKYNKKEIVQKRIVYEPINITFHDDVQNNVRDMWLAYNKRYYADSDVSKNAYDIDDTYSPVRLATKYGLDTGKSGRFLNSIEIYSMGNHVYTKYVLINPIIESFDLDTHDYAEGAKIMQSTMRVLFENVLYAEGQTTDIPGFGTGSPYYDNEYSQLDAIDLSIANTSTPFNGETDLITPQRITPLSNFDLQTQLQVSLSAAQKTQLAVNAASSLASNQRFSFPTANVSNQSYLVDISAASRIQQGVINASAAVSSNGIKIGTSAISSVGAFNSSNQATSATLLVYPIVPTGLTPAELTLFNSSYPPLPSTDSRTRTAPYV